MRLWQNSRGKYLAIGFCCGLLVSGVLFVVFNKPTRMSNTLPEARGSSSNFQIISSPVVCAEPQNDNKNLVDINTATLEDLDSLPGIGAAKAKSIMDFRQRYGDFKDITELLYVTGISDSLFQQVCAMITVEN